jgi:hypothetical protein
MSNQANTDLLERVEELMEYWEGTLHEKLLRQALDSNDLEQLAYIARQAENEMRLQEDYPDVY